MKIKLFTIPNLLTLANLLCGAMACVVVLKEQNFSLALTLIIVAAVFDFFDGFAARLLNQCSPIGKELDSLADVVSFGLAPSLVMMSLIEHTVCLYPQHGLCDYFPYVPLIIVAFSALRLAKFNIDDAQTSEFIGLPTPAAGLLCVSLAALNNHGIVIACEAVVLISVVVALLLISPIRMFALKFKGFGFKGNELRYGFIVLSIALLAWLKMAALPVIITLYVLISALKGIFCRKK